VLAMNIAARSVMPWATSADRGLRSLKNVAVADVKSRPLFALRWNLTMLLISLMDGCG